MATDDTASVVVELSQALPQFNVRCYAGRPLTITIPLEQGDGTDMPASAITRARAQVRDGIDSNQVLHSFDTDDDPIDAVVTDGQITFTATSLVTTSWGDLWPGRAPITTAWWDIEITDEDGETWQMSEPGLFEVIHQVTR
jgi:hypothetical protein